MAEHVVSKNGSATVDAVVKNSTEKRRRKPRERKEAEAAKQSVFFL